MRPARIPIGLQLTQAARAVGRAFDDALAEAGGSLPTWVVILSLKTRNLASQRDLADAVGIREATLTHHLAGMESSGLISRRRDPANRRVQVVELTPNGEAAFARLRTVAMAFDRQLRRGLSDEEITEFESLLGRLAANVGADPSAPPWAGPAVSGPAVSGPAVSGPAVSGPVASLPAAGRERV